MHSVHVSSVTAELESYPRIRHGQILHRNVNDCPGQASKSTTGTANETTTRRRDTLAWPGLAWSWLSSSHSCSAAPSLNATTISSGPTTPASYIQTHPHAPFHANAARCVALTAGAGGEARPRESLCSTLMAPAHGTPPLGSPLLGFPCPCGLSIAALEALL